MRIWRGDDGDEDPRAAEQPFQLDADAGSGVSAKTPGANASGSPGPAKRPWGELCAAIDWELGPGKVWESDVAVEALLRRCGVENFVWMMQGFPPERIVLATCYGLWMALEKKLKAKTPGPLVNKVLRSETTIDDRRHVVLPIIEREFRHAAKQVKRKTEGA